MSTTPIPVIRDDSTTAQVEQLNRVLFDGKHAGLKDAAAVLARTPAAGALEDAFAAPGEPIATRSETLPPITDAGVYGVKFGNEEMFAYGRLCFNAGKAYAASAALGEQAAVPGAEQIAAIEELSRNDPAVHAFMTLKRRDGLAWPDVLARMVLNLANDKAAIAARACELAAMQPVGYLIAPAREAAPVEAKPQIPAGFKLVPIEPTDDMEVAFAEAWFSKARPIDDCQMADAYRDMLAAAPAPGEAP